MFPNKAKYFGNKINQHWRKNFDASRKGFQPSVKSVSTSKSCDREKLLWVRAKTNVPMQKVIIEWDKFVYSKIWNVELFWSRKGYLRKWDIIRVRISFHTLRHQTDHIQTVPSEHDNNWKQEWNPTFEYRFFKSGFNVSFHIRRL